MEVTINTKRLTLREYSPVISKFVFENFDDHALKTYFGLKTLDDVQIERSRYNEGFTMFGHSFLYFYIINNSDNQVMGWCGFHKWYTRHNRAELGYLLQYDDYKRKGYMKESLPFVIKYGFDKMNLHRIEALIGPDNIPSLKLVKSLGFKEEGLLKEHYRKNDKMEDSLIYGLLSHEFRQDI